MSAAPIILLDDIMKAHILPYSGWLRLPIKAIWFSSAFLIVGGGTSVAASVVMMVITDSTPEIKR